MATTKIFRTKNKKIKNIKINLVMLTKELSFHHKLLFSDNFLFATRVRRLQIVKNINSPR